MANWLDSPGYNVPGGVGIEPHDIKPMGFQQITSLSSAAGLTIPQGALFALVQAETQGVRWRDDDTNPTASVGMLLVAGDTLPYTGDLTKLKLIQVTASASVNISYYG